MCKNELIFDKDDTTGWICPRCKTVHAPWDGFCSCNWEKEEQETDTKRLETGALKLGNDWTGLFVRGDDCLGKLRFVLEDWLADENTSNPLMAGFVRFLLSEIENNVNEQE